MIGTAVACLGVVFAMMNDPLYHLKTGSSSMMRMESIDVLDALGRWRTASVQGVVGLED